MFIDRCSWSVKFSCLFQEIDDSLLDIKKNKYPSGIRSLSISLRHEWGPLASDAGDR